MGNILKKQITITSNNNTIILETKDGKTFISDDKLEIENELILYEEYERGIKIGPYHNTRETKKGDTIKLKASDLIYEVTPNTKIYFEIIDEKRYFKSLVKNM